MNRKLRTILLPGTVSLLLVFNSAQAGEPIKAVPTNNPTPVPTATKAGSGASSAAYATTGKTAGNSSVSPGALINPAEREAAAIRALPRDEVAQLLHTAGEPEIIESKSQRRTCIDSGGTWVTNSHGSFCLNRNSQAARLAQQYGVKPPTSYVGTAETGHGPQGWVFFERRRCVRGGGVFFENSSGTFCMKGLSPV